LIAWARRNGCYVLEDDYDADFHCDGSPLPAITSLAPDCTIYLGTFSKSLGAGLRLGYMVVPSSLADTARTAKALLNNGSPWLEQAVVAEMMRSGSFAAHIARVRARYKESRDTLMRSLRRHFGDVDVSGQESGLHVLWRLPPGVPDAPALEALARRARIGLYPLASGSAYDAGEAELSKRSIIMGYAALTPKQIDQGIARLSEAVDEALELPSSPLMRRLRYLRDNDYKTYIVTGGGQDFVRVYSEKVYGIPPEQVVGTAGGTKYGYGKDGKPFLTKEPKLLLNDDNAGKPEGIHLMIGRRPYAAFGNSTGDRQMLEYTGAGDGARLSMIVLHDDAQREYEYGPANGLPDTKVGTFTQALYEEAKQKSWTIISMKNDWKRIFSFES
jgi:Aminotransferase class I and II/haloacid dehalogenase-like hydrolase